MRHPRTDRAVALATVARASVTAVARQGSTSRRSNPVVMRRALISLLGAVSLPLAGFVGAQAAPRHSANERQANSQPTSVTTSASWQVRASETDTPLASPAAPSPALSPSSRPAAEGCAAATAPDQTSGEGIVSLVMSAPGTDWSIDTNTSTVVDVHVDRGVSQQIVLFDGAEPFRYEGFLGTMTGRDHCVTLSVRPDLSHDTTVTPQVLVYSVSVALVPSDSPAYMIESHAPVLYGRSTSAVGDTPLITYGQQSPDPDGSDTDLSYTVIWTHEDVGDGVVAAYEWGLWGRMTDIETVLNEKVGPSGKIISASYLSCGCEGALVYPDILPEDPVQGGETDKPYPQNGASPGLGAHLGIRDATGNNDISPTGTTSFRFQQTLVTAPRPDQTREAAMDTNAWTYRISNDEVQRETVTSSDPDNFLAGQYPQYLIVDIDSKPVGTGSVAVAVQLADRTWYSNDYQQMTAPGPASTFPFYNGGHGRTVIKLPLDWHSMVITGLRLTLNSAQPGTAPSLASPPAIQLIEVTDQYQVQTRAAPSPEIVTGTQIVPEQIGH